MKKLSNWSIELIRSLVSRIVSLNCIIFAVCFLLFIPVSYAEDKPDCPAPDEGRLGGTDDGFHLFEPNTSSAHIFGDGTHEVIVLCGNSPNFTSCEDGWEFHSMDGAEPAYKRPKQAPDGNFTLTCLADDGLTYNVEVGPTNPGDIYHRAFGSCEPYEDECGDGTSTGETTDPGDTDTTGAVTATAGVITLTELSGGAELLSEIIIVPKILQFC